MTMTPWQLYRILELKKQEQIDVAFIDFYSANDNHEYDRLRDDLLSSKELERWHPLLKQCCAAYERGEYLIAVPSLLTVLEGAIAIPSNAPFVRAGDRVEFFKTRIQRAKPDSVAQYMWRSVDAFMKKLYQCSDFSTSPPPARLNRHWILHGRDLPGWDISDALRLLQGIGTAIALRID
jgi:hypothetical protein